MGAPEPVKAEVRHVVNRGIGAMSRVCQFSPWIAGEQMTMADIYVHYVNKIVGSVGSEQLEWDILAQIPGMKEWNRTLRDAAITREVEAGRVANEPAFQAYIQAFIASGKSAVK